VPADAEVLSAPAPGKLSFALLPHAASNANAPTKMIFFMPVSPFRVPMTISASGALILECRLASPAFAVDME
jgi:hypothetical protein